MLRRKLEQPGNIVSGAAVLQFRENATSPAANHLLAWIVIAYWFFLVLLDTSLRWSIPFSSFLRIPLPLFLCAVMLGTTQPVTLSARAVNMWLVLFGVAGVLSSVLSVAPSLGLIKLAIYLGLMLPLLASPTICTSLGLASTGGWRITQGLMALLCVCLGLGILGSTRGIFLNPNSMGSLCVVAVPWFLFQLGHRLPMRRRFAVTGLAAIILVVALSRSRGAAASVVVILITYYVLKRWPSWRALVLSASLAAVMGGILLAGSEWAQELAYKGDTAILDSSRRSMMEETISHFYEQPLVGYGFGMSWLVTSENAASALVSGRLSFIAGEFGNSTLAMLAGGGLLVTMSFSGILLIVVSSAMQSLQINRLHWPQNQSQLAALSGILGMLVHAQAEAWLMAPLTWQAVMFWLLCGIALHEAPISPASTDPRESPPRVPPQTLFPTRPGWNRGPFQPL